MRAPGSIAVVVLTCAATGAAAAPPRYEIDQLAGSPPTRKYLDLNNSRFALSMRQDAPGFLNIVVENHNPNYTEFRPGTLAGAGRSIAVDFNEAQQIVGYAETVDANGIRTAPSRAFVYRDGTFVDLSAIAPLSQPVGGSRGSAATAINEAGEVAGYWSDDSGTHGFLYSQGTMISLGKLQPPWATDNTRPAAVNRHGDVVGQSGQQLSSGPSLSPRAFLHSQGAMRDLGLIGGAYQSAATDINDAGVVVGTLKGFQTYTDRCFVHRSGTMQDIGTLGGPQCFTAFINNTGLIVGSASVSAERKVEPVAYVYVDGQMVDLNSLVNWSPFMASNGWELTDVKAVNDNGILIATGKSAAGQTGYFELVPAALADDVHYHFESSLQDWSNQGDAVVTLSRSTAQRYAGASSLAAQFASAGFASVGVQFPPVTAGTTVTFRIYIPADAVLDWIQPFAQEGESGGWQWHGNWKAASALQLGAWNTLTVDVPADAQPLQRLGVEFFASQPYNGTVYIDSVSFQ